MLRSAKSEKVRLISREIIFQEFQVSNVYDHDTSTSQTDGRTDRRTDGQLALAIPRSAIGFAPGTCSAGSGNWQADHTYIHIYIFYFQHSCTN